MPKLIDADKQIDWIKQELQKIPREWPTSFECGRAEVLREVMKLLEAGTFDPIPPVQPAIKEGVRVRHKDKMYKPYGIGIVQEISMSGKQAFIHWPEFDKKHFTWGGPTPAYYRLDKLEVITDDSSS